MERADGATGEANHIVRSAVTTATTATIPAVVSSTMRIWPRTIPMRAEPHVVSEAPVPIALHDLGRRHCGGTEHEHTERDEHDEHRTQAHR